jgi:hypothetical protein
VHDKVSAKSFERRLIRGFELFGLKSLKKIFPDRSHRHFWEGPNSENTDFIEISLSRSHRIYLDSAQTSKPTGQIEQDLIGAGPTDEGETGGTA